MLFGYFVLCTNIVCCKYSCRNSIRGWSSESRPDNYSGYHWLDWHVISGGNKTKDEGVVGWSGHFQPGSIREKLALWRRIWVTEAIHMVIFLLERRSNILQLHIFMTFSQLCWCCKAGIEWRHIAEYVSPCEYEWCHHINNTFYLFVFHSVAPHEMAMCRFFLTEVACLLSLLATQLQGCANIACTRRFFSMTPYACLHCLCPLYLGLQQIITGNIDK